MNFQQLRYVRETVRQGLNLTEAANTLHTSQPGVSKQIKEFEEELGIEIFERRGKRFAALTEPGAAVLKIIERVLQEVDNLKRVGSEFQDKRAGTLTIATTHTQGNPPQLAQMAIAGDADIAIATESLDHYPQLLALPAYTWHHCVVVTPKHPLARVERLTLEELAKYPIVTYDPAFTGRSHIDEAFTMRGLKADIVLSAIDSDVIKTYVELGLGVGIVAAMAFDAKRDSHLRAIDAGHLFRSSTTRVALRRGVMMRGYAYEFIELFAPQLNRKTIDKAMAGGQENYEL
ncbi:MAG: LysR substrate-binding domain-containing protein [Proteobacteria bacterium]|nr:LysR substrate-binding domain-containing protein [Pseudomonadota bacterium]